MMIRIITVFAILGLLHGGVGMAHAASSFDFQFDGTVDSTVTPPILGTGTFSFDEMLGDGTFALTSLTNVAFNFTFGGDTFTNANIITPLADVLVIISNAQQNVNFGGLGGGLFSGSLDFFNNANSLTDLSFEPNGGSLYFIADGPGGNFTLGTFGTSPAAVPEPSTLALFGSGLVGLLGYSWRKRKQVA